MLYHVSLIRNNIIKSKLKQRKLETISVAQQWKIQMMCKKAFKVYRKHCFPVTFLSSSRVPVITPCIFLKKPLVKSFLVYFWVQSWSFHTLFHLLGSPTQLSPLFNFYTCRRRAPAWWTPHQASWRYVMLTGDNRALRNEYWSIHWTPGL